MSAVVDAETVVERNVRHQTEWYGEPLGDRLGRLRERLELSQAALASTLGLSAPMLSQLMSGNRAKISNPAVLTRLLAMEALVADPEFDELPARVVRQKLAEIGAESLPTSTTIQLPAAASGPAQPDTAGAVHLIQTLLRELASAAEIESAAASLDAEHPTLAEFLRVYGTGKAADARAHCARILDSPP